MFLREVILSGFKSFADRTRIVLGPGVTTIVGPNGCGKSNIVDAIRWVLGEQSAKALRGGKMQDVIFEGSAERKPLGVCEVTLLFSDCERELNIPFNEIEIVRRVSRDGSSDYLMNGKSCRLKDIQRLFMDTGMGRISYSFMVQGQIDQILSSNPAERRLIFEEAAGITRYKSQRREALNKLTLVDQNLARVSDVIEEITRQMDVLKRQASKALRYKRLKHRLTHLHLAHSHFCFEKHCHAIALLQEELQSLYERGEQSKKWLQDQKEELETYKATRSRLYQSLQAKQQQLLDLRLRKEQAESQAELAIVRQKDLIERSTAIQQEIAHLEKQHDSLVVQMESDAESKEAQCDVVHFSDQIFREKKGLLEVILEALRTKEVKLQEKRQNLLLLDNTITRIRSQCTSLEVELKSYQVKHEVFGNNLLALQEECRHFQSDREMILLAIKEAEIEQVQAETALTQAREEAVLLREKYREHQEHIQEIDREMTRSMARVHLLENLQAKYEGFSEGAKIILQGKMGDLLPQGMFHAISKHIQIVDETFALAIETLLGSAVEAIVLKDLQWVGPVVTRVEAEERGRVCLQIPIPVVENTVSLATTVPEGLLRSAMSILKTDLVELSPFIERLLEGCYIANQLEDFLTFWQKKPEFVFSKVVTPEGALIDRKGLLYTGSARLDKRSSGYLQREVEIKRLKKTITLLSERLARENEKVVEFQVGLEEAQEQIEQRQKKEMEIMHQLSTFRTKEKEREESLKKNEVALVREKNQLVQLDESHGKVKERLGEATAELERLEREREAEWLQINATEEELVQVQKERDLHHEAVSQVRLDLLEKRQHLEILGRNLTTLAEQHRDINNRLQQKKEEKILCEEQIAGFEKEREKQLGKVVEIGCVLEEAMHHVNKEQRELTTVEGERDRVEMSLQVEQEKAHQSEIFLSKREIALSEKKSQLNFIVERVRTEYQQEIDQIDWKKQLWLAEEKFESKIKLDELDDGMMELRPKRARTFSEDLQSEEGVHWEEVGSEVDTLRARLASMGAINLVAIEEYASLKERYDFLKNQSEDLWEAKKQLVKAIDEINQTSETLFNETFEQVRKNFDFTFHKLFGGGEANLQLIETEAVLEGGIDIIVRPPGTKLKNLSLLSGGQKAMTALALLFAIYMVKPSPFCVLDELDAPLDDANVGRFTAMLQEFTRYSQFVVITHNKRTVAAADTIYGVTMQERGVTQLVSMRLSAEKRVEVIEEEVLAGV